MIRIKRVPLPAGMQAFARRENGAVAVYVSADLSAAGRSAAIRRALRAAPEAGWRSTGSPVLIPALAGAVRLRLVPESRWTYRALFAAATAGYDRRGTGARRGLAATGAAAVAVHRRASQPGWRLGQGGQRYGRPGVRRRRHARNEAGHDRPVEYVRRGRGRAGSADVRQARPGRHDARDLRTVPSAVLDGEPLAQPDQETGRPIRFRLRDPARHRHLPLILLRDHLLGPAGLPRAAPGLPANSGVCFGHTGRGGGQARVLAGAGRLGWRAAAPRGRVSDRGGCRGARRSGGGASRPRPRRVPSRSGSAAPPASRPGGGPGPAIRAAAPGRRPRPGWRRR